MLKVHFLLFIAFFNAGFISSKSNIETICNSGFIELSKCRLSHEMKCEGKSFIKLLSGSLTKQMWNPQIDGFAKKIKVIIFDPSRKYLSLIKPDPFSHQNGLYQLVHKLKISNAASTGFSVRGYGADDLILASSINVLGLSQVVSGLTQYNFIDSAISKYNLMMQQAQIHNVVDEYAQCSRTYGQNRAFDQINSTFLTQYFELLNNIKPGFPGKWLKSEEIGRSSLIDASSFTIGGDSENRGIAEISGMIVRG